MSDKNKKDNHSQEQSFHQYQNVVQELDQMLHHKQPVVQEPKHPSTKCENNSEPKDMVNNSSSGIKEFDELMDGGFPKGSVILLAGSSGSGKTIFTFQWLFEGIKNKENSVYITLTEPLFKIVENLEKMNFYDRNAIEQEKLKIVDLREKYAGKGFNPREILDFIEDQVKQTNAKRLCIDSITAIAYHYNDKSQIRTFIFELGKILATLGCTTILTSEVANPDKYSMYEVEEFISDAILRLDQIIVNDDLQRVMRIVKVRGKSYRAESIPLKISADGINLFPKIHSPLKCHPTGERIKTGNHVLDEMLMGGVIQGYTTLIAGSTGTGKTLLSLQFIMEGLSKGEPCFFVDFEESKEQLTRNAKSFGWNLEEYEKKGLLKIRSSYPRDKLLEEHFKDIRNVVENNNIKRIVIDSLSSILHSFDEDKFCNFAVRLNGYLKTHNVTSYFTTTTGTLIGSTTLAEHNLSTLTDSIVMLRYVEMQGKLGSVINILKMRGSAHCKDLRKYEITNKGVVIGPHLSDYEGIMTGSSKKIHELEEESEKLKNTIKNNEEMEKALRDSEERFRDISYSMADWIWEVDKDGRYTFSSGNIKKILGYDHDEIIGKTPFDSMPEDEAKRVAEVFKEISTEKKKIIDLENWHLTKKGEKVCIMTNGIPMFNEKNELIGYRGVDKDITERKKTEEELVHARNHFQNLFNSMVDPVVVVDSKGKFLEISDGVEEITGFSREELLGKIFLKTKITTRKSKIILLENLIKRMAGKEIPPYEIEILTKDGKKLPYEVKASKIFYKGKPADMVAFRDVFEKNEMERDIRVKETAISEFINPIVFINLEGKITYVNKSFLKMWRYDSKENILGKAALGLFHRKEQYSDIIESSFMLGGWTGELTAERSDGSLFDVQLSANIAKDEENKPICMMASFVDINNLERLEESLVDDKV